MEAKAMCKRVKVQKTYCNPFLKEFFDRPGRYLKYYEIGGIPLDNMEVLGKTTIRGMIFHTTELLRMRLLRKHTVKNAQGEARYLDLINFLTGLLRSEKLDDKPCLPRYRLPYHFSLGDEVRLYHDGRWTPGYVSVPPSEEYQWVQRTEEISGVTMDVDLVTGEAEACTIRIEFRDPLVYTEQEYRYLTSGCDTELLHILRDNIRHHMKIRYGMEGNKTEAAVAKLIYPTRGLETKYPLAKGDEIMLLYDGVWKDAVVELPEEADLPAVVTVCSDNPETLHLTNNTTFIPKKVWMVQNGNITP